MRDKYLKINKKNQVEIIIPTERKLILVFILGVVMIGGIYLFSNVIPAMDFSDEVETGIKLLFVLIIILRFASFAIVFILLLWLIFGKVHLIIESQYLTVGNRIFGIGTRKKYLINYIKNFRSNYSKEDQLGEERKSVLGALKFDYGFDTCTIRLGISKENAYQIAEYINDKLDKGKNGR